MKPFKSTKLKENRIVAVDVGGTYCDAITEVNGVLHSFKLLTKGVIRCQVIYVDKNKLYLGKLPHLPVSTNVLLNCKVYTNEVMIGRIEQLNCTENSLILDRIIKSRVQDIEISSGKEAPVFAAHILTGIPINKKLQNVELRIGTTKATNALLENKGNNVIYITNKGIGDLLYIKTQQRPNIFQLNIPEPKKYYNKTIEITARLNAYGFEEIALRGKEIKDILRQLPTERNQPIAIALLHSYRNPSHENRLVKQLHKAGYKYISSSSALQPTIHILPRAETTVINAYLSKVMEDFIRCIRTESGLKKVYYFSSSGQLIPDVSYNAKDSLLSGPAGGIKASQYISEYYKEKNIITFDVGGTSTDCACFVNKPFLKFNTTIADSTIATNSFDIHTIAAGGGSIVSVENGRFHVGPQSAGNNPGPACYGQGGPFTLTDVHLLLGNVNYSAFNIPLDEMASERSFNQLLTSSKLNVKKEEDKLAILNGILHIANEKMAEAIRKVSTSQGLDPAEFCLVAFGGGGGLHACAIAELLGIKKIIVPYKAGVLSAKGIYYTSHEYFKIKQINKPLSTFKSQLIQNIDTLKNEVKSSMDPTESKPIHEQITIYLRYIGQNHTIPILYKKGISIAKAYISKYKQLFGYTLSQAIEIEKISFQLSTKSKQSNKKNLLMKGAKKNLSGPFEQWDELPTRSEIKGHTIIYNNEASILVPKGWKCIIQPNKDLLLLRAYSKQNILQYRKEIEVELNSNRLKSIAEEMGIQLQHNAISVNVKERLDFSCALLDSKARLITNAPHIPVHLGSLGLSARLVLKKYKLRKGDVIIFNHPLYGGSHLPDITLIKAVYSAENTLLGYVINRAHHAEIGGMTPGSMPPFAKNLEEEGVCFAPIYLAKNDQFQWESIDNLLANSAYPSRNPNLNKLDILAAVKSLEIGEYRLKSLAKKYGDAYIKSSMKAIYHLGSEEINRFIALHPNQSFSAIEKMDDGRAIKVLIKSRGKKMIIDFTGTSSQILGNLNANKAITQSAVLYVLRLLCNKEIVLNEGLLQNVVILLPESFLNPRFEYDPKLCPPVVGGNTEVSQRLTDCLIKAFTLSACSQGTMNNFLFGNKNYSYYETIGGGAGAGPNFNGRSAIHQHMTNTKITDPEELELRYPVQLEQFSVRKKSGGNGQFKGGNGIERKIKFLEPMTVTLIGQHRKEEPYGMQGGINGKTGEQWHFDAKNKRKNKIPSNSIVEVQSNDAILIKTPGGGGWGKSK